MTNLSRKKAMPPKPAKKVLEFSSRTASSSFRTLHTAIEFHPVHIDFSSAL